MSMKGAKSSIIQAIGQTPIVQLSHQFTGVESEIYVKLEYLNPGGSTKDRIGVYMIQQAVQKGLLKEGGTIIEGTSGNTGVGIAIYAALHGYRCLFVMNDKQSTEKQENLKAYGAQVVICPTDVAPEDPRSYYSVSKKLAASIPNSYYVNQYDNLWNRQTHYEFTAPEIHQQTGGEFDVFLAAVGTGGTLSGCGQYFKKHCPHVKVVGVDCHGSIIAHYWKTGELIEGRSYVLEGIGEDFVPENYDFDVIDDFEVVGDKESFLMTRRLLSEQAIYCGGSSGAAVLGAIRYAQKLKSPQKIVILLHDSGNRYSSKIFNNKWMSENNYWKGLSESSLGEVVKNRPCQKPFVTADLSVNIGQVLRLMEQNRSGTIPVVDGDEVLGVANKSALTVPLFEETLTPSHHISSALSPNFVKLDETDSIGKAVKALGTNHVPIVCRQGKPVDLIDEDDIVHLITKKIK